LFGNTSQTMAIKEPTFPEVPHWSLMERLRQEKEVTGFYLSGHPLDSYQLEVENFANADLTNYTAVKDKPVALAGIITKTDVRLDKNGDKYIRFTLEDFKGSAEFMLFRDDYIKYNPFLEEGKALFIKGVYKQRYKNAELFEFKISSIALLSMVREQEAKNVAVYVNLKDVDAKFIASLKAICHQYPGRCQLKVKLVDTDNNYQVLMKSSIKIEPTNELMNSLKGLPLVGWKVNES